GALQPRKPRMQRRELIAIESRARVPGVHQFAIVVIAEQQRAQMLTRSARLGVAANDELLGEFHLELPPGTRAHPRLVHRIRALRDDPFPAVAPRGAQHPFSVAGLRAPQPKRIGHPALQSSLESLAPRGPWCIEQDL